MCVHIYIYIYMYVCVYVYANNESYILFAIGAKFELKESNYYLIIFFPLVLYTRI